MNLRKRWSNISIMATFGGYSISSARKIIPRVVVGEMMKEYRHVGEISGYASHGSMEMLHLIILCFLASSIDRGPSSFARV